MPDLKRNNLDKSSSPYLRQHADNPVWWQEWNSAVIQSAADEKKPLFVSVGYATCHWCHVMAAEAFSDRAAADLLNDNFICIKVDREQRPDIDQFLMQFMHEQTGSGGWPLNVFLTADLRPIYALTYAPVSSFAEVVKKVHAYYRKNADAVSPFSAGEKKPPVCGPEDVITNLLSFGDSIQGGFGGVEKFPPHSTLLYLLYFLCTEANPAVSRLCRRTLDAMRLRGLHDHLQGGIFRYCIDRGWTIPHFEKMLYDQALALWSYALAFRVFQEDQYGKMAEKIVLCLEESFAEDGLFIAAHDADTEHREGATYTWSYEELADNLSPDEFRRFGESYQIDKGGNFAGRIHLIRKNDIALPDIEKKLLFLRKKRVQPVRDNKIICGINALVAVALVQAGRFLEKTQWCEKAAATIRRLLDCFWNGRTLGHSYCCGETQAQSFLSDAAAMLVAVSMLYEDDSSWESHLSTLAKYVETFREGGKWVESRAADFPTVFASWFDHPVPSGASLAEMGLVRAALLGGKDVPAKPYLAPYTADFFNVTCLMANGLFHLIKSKKAIPWAQLPPNAMQIRGEPEIDCYRGTCRIRKE